MASVVSPTLTLMTSAILVLDYLPPRGQGVKSSFLWDFVVLRLHSCAVIYSILEQLQQILILVFLNIL